MRRMFFKILNKKKERSIEKVKKGVVQNRRFCRKLKLKTFYEQIEQKKLTQKF